ncbi:MAG TPA: hypothetical protein DCX95_02370 [Elusimicrobia bacterium]|nr:hypothetical protein [Elusimicrobiota bacterium]
MKKIKNKGQFRHKHGGQAMTEYLLVVFLISFAVFQAVDTFGKVINVAFLQAINNIAVSIK